jgi:hypothetical protein
MRQEEARTGPRTPSSVIVVDANTILSVVLGRRSRPVFAEVTASRRVVTAAREAEEVRHVLRSVPHLPPEAIKLAEALLGGIEVVPQVVYADRLELARGSACMGLTASPRCRTEFQVD